jgi:Tfp pilus assembly protein FimT
MRDPASARCRSRGASLIETSVVLGVLAVLLSQGLPALQDLRRAQLLRSLAGQLASDLRLARAEAARLGEPVYFRISGRGSAACYVLHLGVRQGCDCAGGQAVCTDKRSAVIRAEWLPADSPVRLSSNAETLQFQFLQALVTQTGSIELRLADGTVAIRHVVALTGRVRSCYVGRAVVKLPHCA